MYGCIVKAEINQCLFNRKIKIGSSDIHVCVQFQLLLGKTHIDDKRALSCV